MLPLNTGSCFAAPLSMTGVTPQCQSLGLWLGGTAANLSHRLTAGKRSEKAFCLSNARRVPITDVIQVFKALTELYRCKMMETRGSVLLTGYITSIQDAENQTLQFESCFDWHKLALVNRNEGDLVEQMKPGAEGSGGEVCMCWGSIGALLGLVHVTRICGTSRPE